MSANDAAREIVEAMGVHTVAAKLVLGMLEPILAGPRAAGRDLSEVARRVDALVARLPVTEATIGTLARVYTPDELREARDFYFSPLGRRWSRFAAENAQTVSDLCTTWSLAAVLAPALRAGGVDDAMGRTLGVPMNAAVVPADWSGVDDGIRQLAIAAVRGLGFVLRVDEMVKAQLAQIGPLGGLDLDAFEKTIDKNVPLELVARLYAAAFTREELDGLVAFSTTPLGRRSVENAPLVERASAEAMQSWMTANPGALEQELTAIAQLLEG